MRLLYWKDPESIDLIEQELRAKRAVGGSTDTVLGLLAELSEKGLLLLNMIKKRSGKPYLILISSKAAAHSLIASNPSLQIEKLMDICWPGPVTLIFKAHAAVPAYMQSLAGKIALRVPNHAGLQALLQRFKGLFSTSANIAGSPIPMGVEELDKRIASYLSCFIIKKQQQDTKTPPLPSTILDCSGDKIKVIRAGARSIEELEKAYGELFW